MAEQVKKMGQAKKAEGEGDPEKKGKEIAAATDTEVQGHTIYNLNVVCPYCHSHRLVDLEFEGQHFTCGNCGNTYRAWY
jgi:transposase-like protein